MSYTLDDWDPDSPDEFDGWFTTTTGVRIRERLHELNARNVCEIGCATGLMTTRLASSQRRILAVTLNEAMAARARERNLPGVSVLCGDALKLRGTSGQFDAIVCCSVLHEVPDVDVIMRKCHELLSPNGIVFVTVPSANSVHLQCDTEISERGERFGVRRLLSPDEWAVLLTTGNALRVAYQAEMILKPYPNAEMQTLDEHVLAFLATYRGPGGAIAYFELEAS